MRNNIIYILSVFILSMFFAGCATEEPKILNSHTKGYSFPALISNYEAMETKASKEGSDDRWSYSNFENGDKIGFYSLYGNSAADDGNGSFENEPMTYSGGTFVNPDIFFDINYFVPEKSTFYYFPWHDNIEYDPNHTQYNANDDYGLELRQTDVDGIEKCLDMLWVYSASSATANQRFAHTFSSIVIIRGEGFQNPPDDKKEIKVVLSKGVSHITLDYDKDHVKNVKLVYLYGYKTESECREWKAWGPLKYISNVGKSDEKEYPEAYYVVLPTTRGNERLSVEYIEMYDNEGNRKKITDFKLYTSSSNTNNSRILSIGERYPLEIKMVGVDVVVSPIEIKPWDDDQKIEEVKTAGIPDVTEFNKWVLAYNQFLQNRNSENYDETLKSYGDKTIKADGSVYWTFYINGDLDFSEYIASNEAENKIGSLNFMLEQFDDCLEGNGNSISGLTVNFIKNLGENGKIQNMTFRGININNGDATQNTGGLLNVCRGTIEKCEIDGTVTSSGGVGLIAAEGINATITDCKLRGLLLGSATASQGMFASASDCNEINNNTAGLIFQTNTNN